MGEQMAEKIILWVVGVLFALIVVLLLDIVRLSWPPPYTKEDDGS